MRVVAKADLAYLWELHDAVADSATREEAQAAGLAVRLPHAASADLAQARSANVDAALAERFAL